jgi:hypothetical protein
MFHIIVDDSVDSGWSEIDNCGLFLEQRRHIFCNGKLAMQQPEHARILPAKVQLLNFLG